MNKGRSSYVAQAGMIAAVYAAATLVALLLLQGLAWGPVQFRISEAVCVLAVLTPAAAPQAVRLSEHALAGMVRSRPLRKFGVIKRVQGQSAGRAVQ